MRRADAPRAAGASRKQVARELGVTDDLLRKWRGPAARRAGAPPGDVFPGHGPLPADDAELKRLERENARLRREVAFLNSAAAYARVPSRGSRGERPAYAGTPRSRPTGATTPCA